MPQETTSAIRDALDLIVKRWTVVELRALGTPRGVMSGYYDSDALDALADDAARLSGRAAGVYVTLNPANPALLARSTNRVKSYARYTTGDADIVALRWLFLDFDPRRPSGISSTDAEQDEALKCAIHVRWWLRDQGWPAGVFSASGNGGHLLYRVDLPNDEPSRELLRRCQEAVSFRFSDETVIVDPVTWKPAQLWRLPGTWAQKGDDTPDRPHRRAKLLAVPSRIDVVTREQLERLVALAPVALQREMPDVGSPFDVERWLDDHQISVVRRGEWKGGRKFILQACPWDPSHTDRAAYIIQFSNGAIAAGCHHASCAGKNWSALRDLIEPNGRPHSGNRENSESQREWPEPVPFHEVTLPPFPADTLPDWLDRYVTELARDTQTPIDLPGTVVLSVLSTACAGKFEVEVKPGWAEPVNLFTVVSLDPGNRKTAVFSAATRPIDEYEESGTRQLAREIQTQETRRKILRARLDKAEAEAGRAKPEERARAEGQALQIALELAGLRVPTPPRLIADDVSPERLATLLHEHGGRIAVLSPEGDIFDLMAGRYSTGGLPNFGVFLRGHSGDPIRVDRVGRPPEYVPRPALTLGVTVQADILRGLSLRPGFRGRGLLGRFLYSVPVSRMGRRDVDPPPLSSEIRADYYHNVHELLRLPSRRNADGIFEPRLLTLSQDGRRTLQSFAAWLEPRLGPLGALGHMTDWAGKLVGAVARISGLLHLAQLLGESEHQPITRQTVEAAICLGRYFLAHARAAYAEMGADPVVEDARYLLAWIVAKSLRVFTLRDLFQGTKGRFKRVEALKPALAVLIEHDFIRAQLSPPRTGPGRKPSPSFEVNPTLSSHNSHNPQNRGGARAMSPESEDER